MKRICKITGIVLAFVMILTIFSACGGKEVSEQTPEENKEQTMVLDSITYKWMDSTETLTVGKELTLDEFGRISKINKSNATIVCQYNENGAITRVDVTDNDGNQGYQSWVFEDGRFTENYYDPNDGFHSIRDAKNSNKLDDKNRVIEMIEDTTYTDAEDGSKSHRDIKYEYEYDENNRVNTIKYYSDDMLDHITKLTYDENGNLLLFVNSDNGSVDTGYLKFTFNYKSVDKDTVSANNTDPYVYVQNWEYLISHIL